MPLAPSIKSPPTLPAQLVRTARQRQARGDKEKSRMRLRDRFQKLASEDKPAGPAGPGEPSPGCDSSLAEAEELLKAGDDAIRQALSGNSAEFLSASRQAGGQ